MCNVFFLTTSQLSEIESVSLSMTGRPPVLVKGLGKPTVQIMLQSPLIAEVRLLSGMLVGTIQVHPEERFSSLREKARDQLCAARCFTLPEALHAHFESNGLKLEDNVLRRKVRKNYLKRS